MHQISIDDQVYADVSRRATDAGFPSVDAYVNDILRHYPFDEETEDLSGFFTPERLALIDEAVAEIDAGKGIPLEEVREHFRRKFSE